MTPSVPRGGDRDRNRDRLERTAAVGAQTLLRACTAMIFFSLEEEKSNERDGKLKRDGVLGSLMIIHRSSQITAVGKEEERRQL